jgi:hypothetical protein
MRRKLLLLGILSACLAAAVLTGRAQVAQQVQGPAAPPRHPSPNGMSQATLDEMLIRFPLPPGQDAYADIDGKYVIEQANIAEDIVTRVIQSSGVASSAHPAMPRVRNGWLRDSRPLA